MFPCFTGPCLQAAGISLLWFSTMNTALANEQAGAVINPLVSLGKLAIALVIVLSVFWIFARVLRQLQGIQGSVNQGLRIVGALPVGQREKVLIVQAGDQQLVLGVTSSQINTLHVLENHIGENKHLPASGDFKQKLSAALKRQVPSQ